MNIFDNILTAASEGAAQGAVEHARATTTFDGTRITPSEGFALTVEPATKSLYQYQLAAVETIIEHRRVLLGLQPGLGKTAIIQAVVAHEAALGKRSLVIVPPSLRISPWANEFAADYPHLNVALVSGTKRAEFPVDADVVILPDSVFAQRVDDVIAWAPQNVFADEGHRYKNVKAKRTIALRTLADALPVDACIVPATGTVVANRVTDVYAPLRITGRENARAVSGGDSYTRFLDAWCDTEVVWTGRGHVRVATGCKDPEGLRDALVKTCYVSVPREDVLDLPERTTAVRSLVLNGDATEYRRIERDFIAWVRDQKGDAAAHRASKAEAITRLLALWEADGKSKVKATTEYVSSLVEQGEQVVLFAHHKSVVAALYEALLAEGISCTSVIGGQSSESKADAVDAFQNGRVQVLIGNITAAGTGLTLHAARHVVFCQLPWSPGDYGQAQDRIFRIGQKRHCTTHVLNASEQVSEHLWAVLGSKVAVADAVNTGTNTTIDASSIEEAVLQSYGW